MTISDRADLTRGMAVTSAGLPGWQLSAVRVPKAREPWRYASRLERAHRTSSRHQAIVLNQRQAGVAIEGVLQQQIASRLTPVASPIS